MTSRPVTVRAVDADALQLVVHGQCDGCAVGGCASRRRDSAARALRVPMALVDRCANPDIGAGDQLNLRIDARKLLALSTCVFLLPIFLMLLLCVTCGAIVSDSNTAMVVAAAAGLLAGGALARALVHRIIAAGDAALLSVAVGPGTAAN